MTKMKKIDKLIKKYEGNKNTTKPRPRDDKYSKGYKDGDRN